MVYGGSPFSTGVVDAWDRACAYALSHTKAESDIVVRGIFNDIFPRYPFQPLGTNANPHAFVQFLALCAMSDAACDFTCTEREAVLSVPYSGIARSLSVSHRNLHTSRGAWRYITESSSAESLTTSLSWSPMLEHRAVHKTDAVLRHLCALHPTLARPLRDVFALAVIAGPNCEAALTGPFEVARDPEPDSPWLQARSVIGRFDADTMQKLSELLVPVVGNRLFRRVFGNPNAPVKRVTHVRQKGMLDALSKLERDVIEKKVDVESDIIDTTEALRLVEVQNKLGRLS